MASALEVLNHLMNPLMVAWTYARRSICHLSPYIYIKFPEFGSQHLEQCEDFIAIQNYLSQFASTRAKWLKAEPIQDSQSLVLSIDEDEEIVDEFDGVKVWWSFNQISTYKTTIMYPGDDEKRFFKLTFHKRHRESVIPSYLQHVRSTGKVTALTNRKRKLFTNNASSNSYPYKRAMWSHVAFDHPSTFDTLAMDPIKKREIINDLRKFQRGKEYYKRIGKTWQRGYLLYGPPGTGKSSMIAAMANLLKFDVYDLELTTVKDNTELKKLLIGTSEQSIIVIEDIDCSLDLTGQRKTKKQKKDEEEKADLIKKMGKGEEESQESKVTLSGLLNFIDGLWSACRGERIIVFTTNFVEKLDPALVRRGRMDKHIPMSYCCFESFKVLAWNYLRVDSHPRFTRVEQLLQETEMTPADVAENLMPKSDEEDEDEDADADADADACLEKLIEALEKVKEEARKKSEEEKAAIAEAEASAAMAEEEGQRTLSEEVKPNGVL